MISVIGLFDDQEEAMGAYNTLVTEGFAKADLDILTNDDKDDEPKLASMRQYVPAPDVEVYLEGVRQGGTIITAHVSETEVSKASEIFSGFNIVNIKQRLSQWQSPVGVLVLSNPATEENVMDVIEEDPVEKEKVERGRIRVYSAVTENPVERQIVLRDETIKVQRRPVNRTVAITPDLFKERSFEMAEVDEIATVSKTGRVLKEVPLSKEVDENIETIVEEDR